VRLEQRANLPYISRISALYLASSSARSGAQCTSAWCSAARSQRRGRGSSASAVAPGSGGDEMRWLGLGLGLGLG